MKWVRGLVYVQEFFKQTSGSWHIVWVCVRARVCCMHVWSHACIFTVCMQCMTLTWNCSIPATMLNRYASPYRHLLFYLLLYDKPMTQLIAACLLVIPPNMTKEYVLSSPAYITSVAYVDSQLNDSPSPQCVLPLSGHLTAASSGGSNHSVLL